MAQVDGWRVAVASGDDPCLVASWTSICDHRHGSSITGIIARRLSGASH